MRARHRGPRVRRGCAAGAPRVRRGAPASDSERERGYSSECPGTHIAPCRVALTVVVCVRLSGEDLSLSLVSLAVETRGREERERSRREGALESDYRQHVRDVWRSRAER